MDLTEQEKEKLIERMAKVGAAEFHGQWNDHESIWQRLGSAGQYRWLRIARKMIDLQRNTLRPK